MSHHHYRILDVVQYPDIRVVTFQKNRDVLVDAVDAHDLKVDIGYIRSSLRPDSLLIDCRNIRFISCDALHELFVFQQTQKKRGKSMTLCGVQEHIDLTLRMFGLYGQFTFADESVLPPAYVHSHAFAA